MAKLKLKKGDSVYTIAGRDKGKTGKIIRILSERNRAVVEGINSVKKHSKPTQKSPQGGIVSKAMPIHLSNLMLMDPQAGKPTRVGKKWEQKKGDEGHWVRIAKKSQAVVR